MATAKKTTTSTEKTATTTPTVQTTDKGFRLALGSVEVNGAAVKDVVADSAYATLGAGDYAIAVARELPQRLENLGRQGARQATDLVKTAPARTQGLVREARGEVNESLTTARDGFGGYAERGRKVVKSISQAASTKRAVEQTDTARSQVKGAVTSVRKALEQGQDAVGTAVGRIGRRRSA